MTLQPLSEAEVEVFILKIKQADNDKKVDHIQLFGLKLESANELPSSTLDAITLTIAPLLKSTSQLLYNSILTSFIPFYLPLLPTSPITHLQLASIQLLPVLLEKLNDAKERTHAAARTCIVLLGQKSYEAESGQLSSSSIGKGKDRESLAGYWERLVKETMGGKGSRAKIECMRVIVQMRKGENSKLALKPWLSPLVDLLEDGDGTVRDQAREALVALLSPPGTPAAAKSELKKLLLARNVRRTIADALITRIFSVQGTEKKDGPDNASTNAEESTLEKTPNDHELPDIVHVANGRDLVHEFAQMAPFFEGKETEHNWAHRESSLVKIRGLMRGQACTKYPESFVTGLRAGIFEGVCKTLLSLRTTVAQQACVLMKELPETMGSAFDPFVENALPVLAKMAGFTKRMIAERSQKCVAAIFTHSTAPIRMLVAHITAGLSDKNVQVRQYAISHLRTLVETQAKRIRTGSESSATIVDSIESGIRRSLTDVNPTVRDQARVAYWSFHKIWPEKGQAILDSLDGPARKQLDKANPASVGTTAPPKPSMSKKPSASSAMSALLAEKRKAKAAELAAGQDRTTARTVSSPVPASPSILQRARASSSSPVRDASSENIGNSYETVLHRESQLSNQRDLDQARARNGSTRHGDDPPSRSRSPESSGSASQHSSLRTPPAPLSTAGQGTLGIFDNATPASSRLIDLNSGSTRSDPTRPSAGTTLIDQADHAESTAKALLDLDETQDNIPPPITPVRLTTKPHFNGLSNGTPSQNHIKTPMNPHARARDSPHVWDDSPRPGSSTPLLFAEVQEKKHERSWWLRRQELMDKASPLKSRTPDPASAIEEDLEQLEQCSPSLRNLQRLCLFAESHPLPTGHENPSSGELPWGEGRLFDRLFVAITNFLEPNQSVDLLEQGLVLLWEMVRCQWTLFQEREDTLIEALFRLRACSSIIIHESVNSLMSLLCDVSEAVFLLSVVHSSLDRYLERYAIDQQPRERVEPDSTALSSGYLFGLTAIGRCIVRIPPDVLRVEVPRLAPVVSTALSQTSTGPRKAANALILAVQAVMNDAQETMDMLELTESQRDFAFYLLAKNKLWSPNEEGNDSVDDQVTRVGRVKEEMDGLLGKGTPLA